MLLHSKWITYTTGEHKGLEDRYGNPAPYFRRSFALEKTPASACKSGLYHFCYFDL